MVAMEPKSNTEKIGDNVCAERIRQKTPILLTTPPRMKKPPCV